MLRTLTTLTLLVSCGCTVRLQFEYENPSTEEANVMGKVLDTPFDKRGSGKVVDERVRAERLRNRFTPREIPMDLVRDPNLREAVQFAAGAKIIQVTACGLCIACHPDLGVLGLGVQRPMPRGASPYPCIDTGEEEAQCSLFPGATEGSTGSEVEETGVQPLASLRPESGSSEVRHQVHPEGLDGTVGSLDSKGR